MFCSKRTSLHPAVTVRTLGPHGHRACLRLNRGGYEVQGPKTNRVSSRRYLRDPARLRRLRAACAGYVQWKQPPDFILKDQTSWLWDMSGLSTEESALFPNGPRKVGAFCSSWASAPGFQWKTALWVSYWTSIHIVYSMFRHTHTNHCNTSCL